MLIIVFLLLLAVLYENNHLTVSNYTVSLHKASCPSQSLQIVHISDLHNKRFGLNQSYLIRKIKKLHPDLIAITGDLVDNVPFQHAVTFVKEAEKICPIYYVRGNHEALAGNFPAFEKELARTSVHILKNTSDVFTKKGYTYTISGFDDPQFYGYQNEGSAFLQKQLQHLSIAKGSCHILLSHRPELFKLYCKYPFDLVLCGHAHGGQFRLPFTDGLYAPDQGILPKYTSGIHYKNHTFEIISRGLGNSAFPLRLWNDPEIVHITIKP